jgi:hypothetical protein
MCSDYFDELIDCFLIAFKMDLHSTIPEISDKTREFQVLRSIRYSPSKSYSLNLSFCEDTYTYHFTHLFRQVYSQNYHLAAFSMIRSIVFQFLVVEVFPNCLSSVCIKSVVFPVRKSTTLSTTLLRTSRILNPCPS